VRILVVNQYFHPDQSSTAQLLTELCEDLAEHHQVTVVCGRPSYSPVEARPGTGLVRRERYGNIQILRTWSTSLSRHSIPGRLTNYSTYLASSLVGLLKAERPDVVFTMTDPPFVAAAAMAAGKARRVPFVYANQDVFPEVALALGVLDEGATSRALRAMNRTLRSSAAVVVAIGRDMERRLVDLGTPASKIRVICNWADTSAIRPSDGAAAFRRAQGWDDRFVVMHSGNVGLSQDLDALLGAAELLRDDPEIVFAIIGEGGSREGLVQQAARRDLGNVVFLPYQPKAELSASLGAADLHFVGLHRGLAGAIVPSKMYGIMAAGRPFLAAIEAGSEPDLLIDELDCGIRVEPGNPGAIADGIVHARKLDLDGMGARGRRAAEERFDRRVSTAAYRRLFEEIAG
jgi:colanic acid biosynthesis glycosyl transferase WcaI